MNNKKKHKNSLWSWLGLIFGIWLFKRLLKSKKDKGLKQIEENFKEFLDEEKEEIKKYTAGKESIEEFSKDTAHILREYFIPYEGNGHIPKIFQAKSLGLIALSLILLKFSLVAYLFFIYPQDGGAEAVQESRILELINKDRQAQGLDTLQIDTVLSYSARLKAQDMANFGYFSHTSPDGKKPWDFVNRNNYPYALVGENLAMSFSSADSVHKALMASPSHQKNILNSKFSDIGLAISEAEIDGKKTSILVQIFSAKVAKAEPVPNAAEETATMPETLQGEPGQEVEAKPSIGVVASETLEPKILSETSETPPKPLKNLKKLTEEGTAEEDPQNLNTQSVSEDLDKDLDLEDTAEEEVLEVAPSTTPYRNSSGILTFEHPGNDYLESHQVQKVLSDRDSTPAFTEPKLNPQVLGIADTYKDGFWLGKSAVYAFQLILFTSLCLLTCLLAINIFIRWRIQHRHVLVRTLAVIALVAGLVLIRFHELEAGVPVIFIS
jgi:uncharacterized protein YkwD